ncbi:hypothetical protein [Clostridium phage Maintenon]|nr:hypothetical protein [Clostridium phage Maintenon]DAH53222.1 MAG TPA: hypothetical protein [Caudoviricetes sp.]
MYKFFRKFSLLRGRPEQFLPITPPFLHRIGGTHIFSKNPLFKAFFVILKMRKFVKSC